MTNRPYSPRIPLTDLQKKFVEGNYSEMTTGEMAKALGIDNKKIWGYCRHKNLDPKPYRAKEIVMDEYFNVDARENWCA